MRATPALPANALFLLLLSASLPARAQEVDLQHFEPSATTTGLVAVKGGAAEGWLVPAASLTFTYVHEPLVAIDNAGNRLGALVSHRLDAVLGFALGLTPPAGVLHGLIRGLDVAALLPVVPVQVGTSAPSGVYTGASATTAGIGDPRLEGRVTLLTRDQVGVDLAMIPVLTVPAAAGGDFFGNGSVTFTPEVAVSTGRGPVFLGVNLGWRVRGNRDLYGMEIADQVLWRAGTGLDLHAFGLPENLGAGVEFWGLTKAVRPFASAKESPIEALASARYRRGDLLVTAGLGSGVSSGYGAPDFRALAAVAWAPRVAPEPEPPPAPPSPPPPPPTCPDGSTASVSADGTLVCPEVVKDADHDGNPDGVDQCPDEPEDQDGFADDDGCPELDNDDDGIPDHTDQCPNVGEDLEGFEDEDGCPDAERDTDGDGVPDFKDQCSKEPEDMDGFQDEDGCPDHDNDLDGIADSADKCPNEAETINAVEDDDGCPDQGATLVKLTREKIEIKEAVYFDTNSDVIQARSFGLLDQVAAVLQNHAEIPKVRVEGHTDDRGAADYNLDLSQRRAASVMAYLVGKGIAAQRLEAAGFGVTRPIESNKTSRGRERNRRVEFVLVEAAP